MKHLVRAGGLVIVILLLALVAPRIVPKMLSATTSLADYGFHIPDRAQNERVWASLPMSYASSTVCSACHQGVYQLWEKADHRTVACENCHGPAKTHVETGIKPAADTSRSLCGTCHAKLISRPARFPQVDMSEMGGEAPCVSCHSPHDPRAGMPPKVPHELEDRTSCQSCHAPHEPLAILPPVLPHTLEGRTECLSCHGAEELRGAGLPRIPHSLEGRSNCLLCHNTGGTRPVPEDHAGRTSATCQNCHQSGVSR